MRYLEAVLLLSSNDIPLVRVYPICSPVGYVWRDPRAGPRQYVRGGYIQLRENLRWQCRHHDPLQQQPYQTKHMAYSSRHADQMGLSLAQALACAPLHELGATWGRLPALITRDILIYFPRRSLRVMQVQQDLSGSLHPSQALVKAPSANG